MSQYTLLFVDDESKILQMLEALFKKDYEVLIAEDGRDALELLRNNEVAVLVTDQHMPYMTGTELLSETRAISPHTVRIMLTGFDDVETARAAINEGHVYSYVTKSSHPVELAAIIRQAAERYELGTINRRITEELQRSNADLAKLNNTLEEKVVERTRKLQIAYEDNLALTRRLQLTIAELRGKDRIAKHLMGVHSLEDTLTLIIQVVVETLHLERAIIYLQEGEITRPAAAMGLRVIGLPASREELAVLELSAAHRQIISAFKAGDHDAQLNNHGRAISPFAIVPIMRESQLLGFIEAARSDDHPLGDGERAALDSFAIEAAVAISDAQRHASFDIWQCQLEDMLKGLDDLERLID